MVDNKQGVVICISGVSRENFDGGLQSMRSFFPIERSIIAVMTPEASLLFSPLMISV